MKIQRAREHIAAVESAVGAWLATDAYSIVREEDEAGLTALRVRLTQDPPARIALLVGDVVHNLRSALDHAVYHVALRHAGGELPPEAERELMYPIIDPAGDPAKDPQHHDRAADAALDEAGGPSCAPGNRSSTEAAAVVRAALGARAKPEYN